jgi:hypothetical protein
LVELSPFLEVTGPALFNWKADDGLLKGAKKRQFRAELEARKQLELEKKEEERTRVEKEKQQNNDRVDDDDNAEPVERPSDEGFVSIEKHHAEEKDVEAKAGKEHTVIEKVTDDAAAADDDAKEIEEEEEDGIEFRVLLKGHAQASELVESNWEQRWRRNDNNDNNDSRSDDADRNKITSTADLLFGYWDLLPRSQDLALHPKTKNKREIVHNISKYIVAMYFGLLHMLKPFLHEFSLKRRVIIAHLQETRAVKLECLYEKERQQYKEDLNDGDGVIRPSDDIHQIWKKLKLYRYKDRLCDKDMLIVSLIDFIEYVYSIEYVNICIHTITSFWSMFMLLFHSKFFQDKFGGGDDDGSRLLGSSSLYYSFEQILFMLEYFVTIFKFEYRKREGPALKHVLFVYGTLKVSCIFTHICTRAYLLQLSS